MGVFGDLQAAVKKEIYVSNFDFGSREIEKKDIEFIKNSEQKLRKSFMAVSDSLYDICVMLNQVSFKFKKSGDFTQWYEANGLTKDNISEFNKRFILFQEFKEKKDFIASLSNQSVKFLTHKDVTADAREKIIDGGIKKAETIKELLAPVRDQIAIEFKSNKKKPRTYVDFVKLDKVKDQIIKAQDKKELDILKAEFKGLEKYVDSMKKAIRNKEKEWEHKNNLTIDEVKNIKKFTFMIKKLKGIKKQNKYPPMSESKIDLNNDWWGNKAKGIYHANEEFKGLIFFKDFKADLIEYMKKLESA